MLKNKKLVFFLLAIIGVLVFTFTLAEHVNKLGQSKAPWLYQTEKELIIELRMKMFNLTCALSVMAAENRHLRRLVFTTKPDHWITWLELLDECKRLRGITEEQQQEIKTLRRKLDRELWQMPAPHWKI